MSTKSEKARAAIAAAVITTAAAGGVPIFVDVAALVAANSTMLLILAQIHSISWNEHQSGSFIRKLIEAGGITVGSIKLLATVVTFTGVGLPVGIAMNAALNALVTYGIGKAASGYFESGCKKTDGEVISLFLDTISFGGFKEVLKILKKK